MKNIFKLFFLAVVAVTLVTVAMAATPEETLRTKISEAPTDGTKYQISLDGNIELTSTLTFPSGTNIELDGNNYSICRAESWTNSTPNTAINLIDIQGDLVTKNVTLDAKCDTTTNGFRVVSIGKSYEIYNTTIQNGYLPGGGGANVLLNLEGSTFTMHSGKISNGYGKNSGGVFIYGNGNGATFTMHGGEISNNTGTWYGSAIVIYNEKAKCYLNGGTIQNNKGVRDVISSEEHNRWGGAIFCNVSSVLHVSGDVVFNNNTATFSDNVTVNSDIYCQSSVSGTGHPVLLSNLKNKIVLCGVVGTKLLANTGVTLTAADAAMVEPSERPIPSVAVAAADSSYIELVSPTTSAAVGGKIKYFSSIADAAKNSNDITLLKSSTESFSIDANTTLNLGDKTLSGTITIAGDKKLTIKGSSTNNTINLVNSGKNGYIFQSWHTDEACSDNTKVENAVTSADVNGTTYYAKWEKATYSPDVATLAFGEVVYGYTTAPAAQDVTFTTNDSVPTINSVTGSASFVAAYNGLTVTVTPKTDLDANTYNEEISVELGNGDTVKIPVTMNVAPAILTATYAGETIKKGQTPELKVTVTGFVNGETAEVLTATPTLGGDYDVNTVGEYTLTPEGGAADNYVFTYTPGVLKVERRSSGGGTPAPDKKVESPKTFDAGIALYVGMALSSAAGAAYVCRKK